jgi:RimJ/RimL family protein N-acetyltransferase
LQAHTGGFSAPTVGPIHRIRRMELVFDRVRVGRWVSERTGVEPTDAAEAIGCEAGGVLVAGIAFDNLTDNTAWVHIASDAEVFPRSLLAAAMQYVFERCGLERGTFLIRSDNARCLAFVRKLGAELEFVQRRAFKDADLLWFVLWHTCPMWQTLKENMRARTKSPIS